ncbi:MAG: VWA domain-containing protein [Acidobacteria bacterium]|nr:VWA domain-containing protein [Acidobacteriota bacterium]
MTGTRIAAAAGLAACMFAALATSSAQDGPVRSRRATPPQAGAPQPAGAPAQSGSGLPIDNDPIQLSTDVVNVLFSVTDRQNRFVDDVEQAGVVVSEDGQTQEVFSFRKETNLPLVCAIVIDVSSSQEFTFGDEKRAALSFLQTVLKTRKDTAALVRFREDVDFVQGLTNRLDRVNDAFNRLTWESKISSGSRYGATALYDAIGVTATELFPPVSAPDTPEAVTRRAIILLTDGDDNASQKSLQDAIDDAQRTDVIVYALGIGDRYRSTAVKRDVLTSLSEQTGGRAYFPESYDDLRTAFQQINLEMRSQYLIAYEPTNAARDGAFRSIDIRLPGRSDVKVFHRRGYFAPRSGGPSTGASAVRP